MNEGEVNNELCMKNEAVISEIVDKNNEAVNENDLITNSIFLEEVPSNSEKQSIEKKGNSKRKIDEILGNTNEEEAAIEEEANKENAASEEKAATEEETAEKTVYRPSLSKRLCNDIYVFDLHQFLQKSCMGRGILKDYETNNILSRKNRNNLVTLIITHFLDQSRLLTNKDIDIIATKISELFPNEISETYYVPPPMLEFKGHIRVSIARGKLIDKHRNLLRELRQCGLFEKKKVLKRKINIDNANSNDSYIWLKNNREPFTDVIEHWNKSYIKRQESQAASIAEFVKDWPILSLPNGYVLIENDFAQKYPNSVHSIYRNFDHLMNQILLHHLPKKAGGSNLNNLLNKLNEEFISDDEKDLTKFQILPYIIPQSGPVKGKVRWKPSITESKIAFISIVKIPGEIENLIEERRHFCKEKGITLQPFVLVVSDDNNFSSYVIIDDIKYKLPTIRKAVDVCFKSFHTFNAKYPAECEKVWYFLQRGVYGFETEFDCIKVLQF